ncbi:Major facilitator superfamily domain containing protein [Naviculisporaceae sp. PSN 640]
MPGVTNLLPRLSPRWKWRSHPVFITLTIAIGQFSDNFLFGMRVPLIPVLVHDHLHITDPEENQRRTAIILASFSAAILVSALPVGWIADFRFLRGYLYLVGLGTLLWSIVVFYTSESFVWMIASRGLNGFSAAVLYAAGYAMVADSVGAENLGKALGTIRSIVAAGEISGPPLGGLIFARWGFDGILNVSLGVLVIDLIMRLLMVDKPARQTSPATPTPSSPKPDSLPQPAMSPIFEDDEYPQGPVTETAPLIPTKVSGENNLRDGSKFRQSPSAPTPKTRSLSLRLGPLRIPLPSIAAYITDRQIIVCLFLSMAQYIMLGSYASTLSLELELPATTEAITNPSFLPASEQPTLSTRGFGLDASKVGLVYLSLCIPNLLFAPIAGWAVDRFGSKTVAVTGYSLLTPSLVWMIIPNQTFFASPPLSSGSADKRAAIRLALFCLGLIMQGFCMGIISTPAMVRAKRRITELQMAETIVHQRRQKQKLLGMGSSDTDGCVTDPPVNGDEIAAPLTGYGTSNSASSARKPDEDVKVPRDSEDDSDEDGTDIAAGSVVDEENDDSASGSESSDSVMGQLFGLNTMVFSCGLLVGNFSSAALRTSIGYGGMCLVWAGVSATAASLVWVFLTNDKLPGREEENEDDGDEVSEVREA